MIAAMPSVLDCPHIAVAESSSSRLQQTILCVHEMDIAISREKIERYNCEYAGLSRYYQRRCFFLYSR